MLLLQLNKISSDFIFSQTGTGPRNYCELLQLDGGGDLLEKPIWAEAFQVSASLPGGTSVGMERVVRG